MPIELLSVGNELLSGQTVNTNASDLARALLEEGFVIEQITTLPDRLPALKAGMEEALSRTSIVIVTGGLGPTGDDLTREAAAEVMGAPLILSTEVQADLRRRFKSGASASIENQSLIVKGSHLLPNPIGTAPGMVIEKERGALCLLPGVPAQMREMLPSLLSYLKEREEGRQEATKLYLALLSESEVDPYLRALEEEHPPLTIGICPHYGLLSLYLLSPSKEVLFSAKEQIAYRFATYYYSDSEREMAHALSRLLVERGETLAVAESCSGGALAAKVTALSGASRYFLGGVVSYSNALKCALLSVSPETLERCGAVSRETAVEMAQGMQQRSGADFVIALSGVMGPTGGSAQHPVGTIYGAIATPKRLYAGRVPFKHFPTKREVAIDYTTNILLAMLWRLLAHEVEPFQ